jgi:hypothetical protein
MEEHLARRRLQQVRVVEKRHIDLTASAVSGCTILCTCGPAAVCGVIGPVVDDDKRAAILARRERGESIRTIAAGVRVSVGVVHKTLAEAKDA